MNIDLLTNTLEVTENPGLDTLDPRFMDIASLIESGDYLGAATQAEEILEEGVYDIRIAGYFLYGVFLEQGVGAVTAILGCMTGLLTENWDALGPATNREKHTQTSLNWFLRLLMKKLQYEEGKESEVWEEWVAEVSSDDVQEALDANEQLQGALGSALEDEAGPVLEGLSKVNDWLRTFQQVVYREPEAEPEPEEEAEPAPAGAEARAPSALAADAVSAEGSYHLKLLLKKMEVFERLVDDEQFSRAAIVADDINQIVANFDPRIYFPKIFSKYSLLLALNIEQVAGFEENKGSVEWQTMQDLYKVDLDSFISLDADITYTSSPAEQADYDEDEDYEGEEHEEEDEMYGEPDESEEDEYD